VPNAVAQTGQTPTGCLRQVDAYRVSRYPAFPKFFLRRSRSGKLSINGCHDSQHDPDKFDG
jgi:hypothetical protein